MEEVSNHDRLADFYESHRLVQGLAGDYRYIWVDCGKLCVTRPIQQLLRVLVIIDSF